VATGFPTPILESVARRRSRHVGADPVDPQIAMMLVLADLTGNSKPARSPAEARRGVDEGAIIVDAPAPLDVDSRDMTSPGSGWAIPLRRYEPHDLPAPSPGLVYFHGGGWVAGSVESHDRFCRRLAAMARCRIVSVDYRLAPEHPFPTAVEDARAAFAWVAENSPSLGIDPAHLGIGGDSAGGNLATVVARHARGESIAPVMQLLIYPAVDATLSSPSCRTFAKGFILSRESMDWYLAHYTGGTAVAKQNPDLSPFFAEDLAGMAPAFVYTAGFDPLRDEARAYVDRLRAAGVAVEYCCFGDLVHGFAVMTGICRAAMSAVERIANDTRRALGG
jgi:acetyl esterase